MSTEASPTLSPGPWHLNPAFPAPGHGVDPSPILAADGSHLIEASEWLSFNNEADLTAMAAAWDLVDALGAALDQLEGPCSEITGSYAGDAALVNKMHAAYAKAIGVEAWKKRFPHYKRLS